MYSLKEIREMKKVDRTFQTMLFNISFYPNCILTTVQIIDNYKLHYILQDKETGRCYRYYHPIHTLRNDEYLYIEQLIKSEFPDVELERRYTHDKI